MKTAPMTLIGILIENQLLASKVRLALEKRKDFLIGFDCNSFKEFHGVEVVAPVYPDVLLLEVDIKENQKFEVIRHFATNYPSTRIIALSDQLNLKLLGQLLKQGVHAFRSVFIPMDNLDSTITDVMKYGAHFSPDMDNLIRQELSKSGDARIENLLSKRELEIAKRIMGGKTYKELAKELHVSVNTINHHLKNIYRKLGTRSKAELVAMLHEKLL